MRDGARLYRRSLRRFRLREYLSTAVCERTLVEKPRLDMEIHGPANRADSKSSQTGRWYVEYVVHKRDVLRPGLQLDGPYLGRRAGVEEEDDHLRRVIVIRRRDPVTVPAVEHDGNQRRRGDRRARNC